VIIPSDQEPDVVAGFRKPASVITTHCPCAYYSHALCFFHGNILPEKHVYIEIQRLFLIEYCTIEE